MRAVKPWVTALQIDEGTFASWIAKVPKHVSVTFWCLDKGHLRLAEYFDWAMNHYGLPYLQAEYFGTPANRELWSKIQSVANWSPELLPLEEWDGTVFVACVEPPEDIRWSFPVQYILASPRDLKVQWERLHSEPTMVNTRVSLNDEVTSPSISAPAAAPVKTAAPIPPPAIQAPVLNLAPPSADAAATAPKVEAPEGFKLNLNLPPSAPVAPETPRATPADSDSPEGLNLNFMGKKVLNLDAMPPAATSAPPPAAPATIDQDDIVTGVVPNPLMEETSSGFVLVQNQPSVTPPASDQSGAVDSDRLAPGSLESARSETEAIAWVFQQLKQYFRHSWLFMAQNGTLKVWRWDSAAKASDPSALEPIDLNQPSLFRIVSRTAMPYHGHVVESPTNTGFFRMWGLRTTPTHVTAVPLISDGRVVAILLCSGEKPAQPDQVLRFTEKMSLAITNNLGKKAAAA